MSIEAMKQALEALEANVGSYHPLRRNAITSLRQAIATEESSATQEPVSVKHMMEWVAFLKARSDNGQHKQIPSNLSAGACWDLAVELEQFINTHPYVPTERQPKAEQWLLESTQDLAKHMAKKFYPEVTQWEVLDNLAGVISQIDNMVTGLIRKPKAEQEPKREPLTIDQVWASDEFMSLNAELGCSLDQLMELVEVIEAAHGIKGEA